jgi:hypothetical protein
VDFATAPSPVRDLSPVTIIYWEKILLSLKFCDPARMRVIETMKNILVVSHTWVFNRTGFTVLYYRHGMGVADS